MSGGLKVVLSDLQKLQTAHDNYANVDTGLSELCQQLTLAGSGD